MIVFNLKIPMSEELRREKREFSDFLGGKVNINRKNLFQENLCSECSFTFGTNADSQEKLEPPSLPQPTEYKYNLCSSNFASTQTSESFQSPAGTLWAGIHTFPLPPGVCYLINCRQQRGINWRSLIHRQRAMMTRQRGG